jgi:hypothetical protein
MARSAFVEEGSALCDHLHNELVNWDALKLDRRDD